MTSSASDAAYALLAPPVQKWVHDQGWKTLSDAQIGAIEPVLANERDVLITAATAGGKTEAAFLPILSHVLERRGRGEDEPGVDVLYISPLKALINDQCRRLEEMCENLDIPVHPWHGDVAASRKKKVWRDRSGVLLITPESIEGLLCNHGARAADLLHGLRYVVVDELHAFPGGPRGAQLASLLHRIDLVARRHVPRVGLSATLGQVDLAADFLRPGRPDHVVVVEAASDGRDRRTSLRGYTMTRQGGGPTEVVDRLWQTLRGQTNLVFANTRRDIETYADRLRHECERRRLPNEFFAHHGSLSKAEREDVEDRLKSADQPATAVCTSTLEMGIDIGRVKEVAQVGCPPSVAALRQRWGRSGRRPGEPSILRSYVTEVGLEPTTTPQDAVRWHLVQAVAMLELVRVDDWCEDPEHGGLHLSTLVQQVLSLSAQHGGVHPAEAESALCRHGPFRVDSDTFSRLVEAMHDGELLMRSSDGLLLPGRRGERVIEHFSFFAAFESPEVLRVVASGGREIGSIGAGRPIYAGQHLLLAGRRWRVVAVHLDAKVVEVVEGPQGKAPTFDARGSLRVHDRVREKMEELYLGDLVPAYLDEGAARLMSEGRTMFAQLRLHERDLVARGGETVVFPWRGDKVLDTLVVALHQKGIEAEREGPALVVERGIDVVRRALDDLVARAVPNPLDLAATVVQKEEEKWDHVLSDQLLDQAYAARALDVAGAWNWLRSRGQRSRAAPAATASVPTLAVPVAVDPPTGPRVALGSTPFAVIDVETTGLSAARGHRIVEIAVVTCRADGSVEDFWHTLLDPAVDVGPSRVHGLVVSDVMGAPSFADVAGDVAARLEGRVVVAHNAPFDLSFLRAEFARARHPMPDWPVLCSMSLVSTGGRSLAAACAAVDIELENAHSAREDALATAALFARQLSTSAAVSFEELGVSTVHLPARWRVPSPSGRAMPRTRPSPRLPDSAPIWSSAGETAYAEAVHRAVEDGEVTGAEIDHLLSVARTWSLNQDQVATAHRELLTARPVPTEARRRLSVVERTASRPLR